MWECQCDCGNMEIIYVSTTDLRQGRKSSCGCGRKRKKQPAHNRKDLTNQKFGKLTALYPIEGTSPLKWHCICDCGQEVDRYASSLSQGKTFSCGCYLNEIKKDIIGEKFGKLTVIKRVDNYISPKGQNQIMYECQCDCGNITIVASSSLKSGATQSCGCIRSKGEEILEKILIELNIKYQREYRFVDCKDKKSLPFDFAIFNDNEEILFLIELNGKQHYEPRFGNSPQESQDNLIYTQNHDNIKMKYCQENNIDLLIIHYSEIPNIKNIIIQRLKIYEKYKSNVTD